LRRLFDVDQKRDTVVKLRVVYRLVEGGWCGHRFPRLAHAPDVSGQRLEGQGLGFVERPTRRDAAGEIGKLTRKSLSGSW